MTVFKSRTVVIPITSTGTVNPPWQGVEVFLHGGCTEHCLNVAPSRGARNIHGRLLCITPVCLFKCNNVKTWCETYSETDSFGWLITCSFFTYYDFLTSINLCYKFFGEWRMDSSSITILDWTWELTNIGISLPTKPRQLLWSVYHRVQILVIFHMSPGSCLRRGLDKHQPGPI